MTLDPRHDAGPLVVRVDEPMARRTCANATLRMRAACLCVDESLVRPYLLT